MSGDSARSTATPTGASATGTTAGCSASTTADELADCRGIIDKNLAKDHPGILYAQIRWLDSLLEGLVVIEGAHDTTDSHLSRLHQEGITGYDVLLEAAAVYRLYEWGHPKRIHSHRHLLYMLGLRTILLKAPPTYKRGLTGRANRVLGTAINKRLGALLLSISRTLDAKEEAKQREVAVLYEPLEL